jgi:hypothetical protein
MQLPAHLATPEAAAQIAAANAAASGGIKTAGGFPRISIKANKFHEIDAAIDAGAPRTYMVTAVQGQPALPMMCLEAVVIAANPAITKTYYEGEYLEGSVEAPNCQSSNGIVPDAHVVKKESPVCATCPKNQWGSKVSKLSGKDIKACDDSKQLAILPGADLTYKALGLEVHKGSLKNWGLYVKALSERGYPITGLVTNITFDHTANGILQFAFNRFLTPAEYAQVQARAEGADVKAIVTPTQTIALPAPAVQAALPAPAQAPVAPIAPPAPAPVAPPPPAPPVQAAGFGAAPAAAPATPTAAPVAPVAPRTRKPREKAPAAAVDLSHLPPAIKAAVEACGVDSPAGVALLAQFPAPVQAPVQPVAPTPAPAPVQAPVQPAGGFGTTVATPAPAPAAGSSAAATSLKALLQAKLGATPPAGQ